MSEIYVLAIGDIVGPETIQILSSKLRAFKKNMPVHFTVANGENASHGNGLTPEDADAIFDCGVDVITSGNHIWHKNNLHNYLDDKKYLLRPANYPTQCPGKGAVVFEGNGMDFLVMNVMGTVFTDSLANPFETVDRLLLEYQGKYDYAVLDIHAEATSEKIALARYLDGRVHVIFGTHTHVPTADEQILKKGSGYITDLGMSGPTDSILGLTEECIIRKFLTHMPVRHELAKGPIEICGALFTVDTDTKRVISVRRIKL